MGSTVAFYCGPSDTEALQVFAVSLGLHLVPMTIDKDQVSAPKDGPYCYLSLVPKAELHPFGKPPTRITATKDPLLGFMRAYFADPYLVLGHIQWSDDVRDLASRTKPYFQKLRDWISKEWKPYGNLYIGPEANGLVAKGAQLVSALPGRSTFTDVKI